jgi:hypothetical protein
MGNFTNWGAMSFHHNGGIPCAPAAASGAYTSISLAVHSSALSTDEIQLALYGTADPNHPFSPQFLSHYVPNCALDPAGWVHITVPMADLLPPPSADEGAAAAVKVQRVELKGNYATGVGGFWLDRLEFGGM